MTTITLWHNPRCSKSRDGLKLLQEAGAEIELRKYLDEAPDEAEIRAVLDRLGVAPIDMMRTREKLFRELGLSHDGDPDMLIRAMAEHPRLIERPIGIRGDRARIGRPPENLLELL